MQGDLIEAYKWMKGINKCDINKLLMTREPGRTCSNGLQWDKLDSAKTLVRMGLPEE